MTLGFKAAGVSQDGDSAGAIELYQEGLRLALELRSQDDVVQQWWRLAIERARAGDLDGALSELAGQGITPEKPPYTVSENGPRICFVRDPDGYRIELIESRRAGSGT